LDLRHLPVTGDGTHVALSTLEDCTSISTLLRQMIKVIVTSFHAQNFVHGDIQDSNLLVHMDEMKLIDFDWGGKEGEVRYPVLINNHAGHHPPNVVGAQLIRVMICCWLRIFSEVFLDLAQSHIRVSNLSYNVLLTMYYLPAEISIYTTLVSGYFILFCG
jgi:serine/threonine protein kinase